MQQEEMSKLVQYAADVGKDSREFKNLLQPATHVVSCIRKLAKDFLGTDDPENWQMFSSKDIVNC